MKRILSIFMATVTVVSVLGTSFPSIAQEIEENNAVLVSEKVSAMCEKYDTENVTDELTEDTETTQHTVEERLIVKTDSRINTYEAVESVYGLGYAFIQFENDEDADAAFATYQKQGYTVQYDFILSLDEVNSDASSSQTNNNWAYERIEIPKTLEALETTGKDYADITVGVIDTGVDYTHELLADRVTRTDLNFSSSGNENDCMDDYGHGTSVAGIVALSTPDNVKIEPYKLLNSDGKCATSELYCLLEYIINLNDKPDVINMSFGIQDAFNEIDISLFEELYNNGITVVVSSGNDYSEAKYFKPANIEPFITVGASDENNKRCGFSNFGNLVDIAAPGTNIYTSDQNGTFSNDFSGTSAAAPFVAAAAATVLMQNDKLSPAEVEIKIKETAVPIQKRSDLVWCGAGLVNFYSLIDQPKLGDVEFSYTGGDYYEPIAVEFSCGDPNAKIIYTTDMSVPSLTNGTVYTDPIEVTEHSLILAVAYDENNNLKSDYAFSEYRVIYEAEEKDFEITDDGSIRAYNGEHKAIIIPDTINGITPVEIGRQCFYQDDIEYVELPDCITDIQKEAFRESSLESISGYGVEWCDRNAFYDCQHLYYENMPNINGVSARAFSYCILLTDFTFKDKLLDAGDYAFSYTSLLEADFPNLEIQERAFESTPCYYASLPKITYLEGGFGGCHNLQHIYIPNLTGLSNSAFRECILLDENDIDFSKITEVGNNGFSGSYFEVIDLPNCTVIEDGAFLAAQAKSISIPKAKEIGEKAFNYAYHLEEVNLESLEKFDGGSYTFGDCVDLKYLYLPNTKNLPSFYWQEAIDGIKNNKGETQLEFIYAPQAIGFENTESDFYYCEKLQFIFAPNLESLNLSMQPADMDRALSGVRFPKDSNVKLYLSDELATYSDYITSVAQLTIVAPESSYAHTVANENGYEFVPSDYRDSSVSSPVNVEDKGRSIRVTKTGLRFGFSWNKIPEIENLASDIEYGFIYHYNYDNTPYNSSQLTVENVGTENIKQKTAYNLDHSTEGTTVFNLVFTDIPASNYDTNISVRAYVCIDGMYFYSNSLNGSFEEVSSLVLQDEELDQNTKNAVEKLLNKEA